MIYCRKQQASRARFFGLECDPTTKMNKSIYNPLHAMCTTHHRSEDNPMINMVIICNMFPQLVTSREHTLHAQAKKRNHIRPVDLMLELHMLPLLPYGSFHENRAPVVTCFRCKDVIKCEDHILGRKKENRASNCPSFRVKFLFY